MTLVNARAAIETAIQDAVPAWLWKARLHDSSYS